MGFINYRQPQLNISFRADYRKASFGLFHIAFLDNDDHYVLPIEDRESILSALKFYHEKILPRKEYPVYNGKTFTMKPTFSKEVLFQVLGLPDEINQKLDISQDILPQLIFVSELSDLKRECYVLRSKESHRKWFNDDFKLYCLNKGFYFYYEETKPFIERDESSLPIFIDEEKLGGKMKRLYEESTSSRLAIDFLGDKDDNQFNMEMEKLDRFSLSRRISYFINNDYDQEIADSNLDPVFRRKYAYLLREYISTIINVLYDDYCFDVLHKVTAKLSYLSVNQTYTNRNIYSISSYNADMYSLDGKHYFFALEDKDAILSLIRQKMEKNPGDSILTLYASLGLPYLGYEYVRHLEVFTPEDVINLLSFGEVSASEIYLSSKRYDTFYSYLSGEEEHHYAFFLRKLLNQGIIYSSSAPLLSLDNDNEITITIKKEKRSPSIACLFDERKTSLGEDVLPSFLLEQKILEEPDLERRLRTLDEKSQKEAMGMFYHSFSGNTLNQSVDKLLAFYNCPELKNDRLMEFFRYLLLFPIFVAEQEYRITTIERKDTLSLMVLDGLPKLNESYEPNLPFPYVTFGKIAYSFRKSYFSRPYLCECQKDAIQARIEYFSDLFDRYHTVKTPLSAKNGYILSQLGLPDNISSGLHLDRELFPQLPFKKNLCHCCHHSAPSYHESIDDNEEDRHNVYLTYIRANASLHGLFFDEAINSDYDLSGFFNSLSDKTYHCILNFDRKRIDPILLPYVNVSKKMIVAMLSSFFSNDMTYDDFYQEVLSFVGLGDSLINRLLFDCREEDYPYIYQHMTIFTRLVYLYKMIEISYALYVSQDIIPRNENEFTLNIDYNPRLPHPYVLLGEGVNAYCDSLYDDHYYLCECDKANLLAFGKRYLKLYNDRKMDSSIKTSVILGLLGFPYLVNLKYADYDLTNNTLEDLFSHMNFRPSICRRDLGIAHASYDEPFLLAFPFKDDMESDYDFAINSMMHDGFKVISDLPLIDIRFRSDYRYDLDSYGDSNLPYFDYCTDNIPETLFTYFVMGRDNLKDALYEFGKLNTSNMEANAYSSGVILDSYFRDDQCILKFVFDLTQQKTLREMIREYFPEIERVRGPYQSVVMQQILGFITYLVQKLFERYARQESHIGR